MLVFMYSMFIYALFIQYTCSDLWMLCTLLTDCGVYWWLTECCVHSWLTVFCILVHDWMLCALCHSTTYSSSVLHHISFMSIFSMLEVIYITMQQRSPQLKTKKKKRKEENNVLHCHISVSSNNDFTLKIKTYVPYQMTWTELFLLAIIFLI